MFRPWHRVTAKSANEITNQTQQTRFSHLVNLFRKSHISNEFWEQLEELLIAADVGTKATLSLTETLRMRAKQHNLSQPEKLWDILKNEMVSMLTDTKPNSITNTTQSVDKPWIILMLGVNGSGKTTSIAKLAYLFKKDGRNVLLAGADTFRAAGIDQLRIWSEQIGIHMVTHQPGSDPGAVVFDAFHAAKARGSDILLIDTAGRLHTKIPLLDELKKINRILERLNPNAPHEIIMALDSTTGQNGLNQARDFTKTLDVSGLFLTKWDGTARGGIIFAIRQELELPILFVGDGEELGDLAFFEPQTFVEALLNPVL